ncbi:MAG TPA: hypothetical protein VIY49_37755 [Bryobacteraceae bacterium]
MFHVEHWAGINHIRMLSANGHRADVDLNGPESFDGGNTLWLFRACSEGPSEAAFGPVADPDRELKRYNFPELAIP